MKKQNVLVLCIVTALIATVALIAVFVPSNRSIPENAPAVDMSTAKNNDETIAAQQPAETPDSEMPEVKAYLVMSVCGMMYEPLPLAGEGSFVIKQDENTSNTVHVTPDSVWMEHSTCENQDCVDQGTVSLENMESRVLSNMIICLPNEVVLELHTPETLASTFGAAE